MKDSCRRNHEGLLYVGTLLSADGARETATMEYRVQSPYGVLHTLSPSKPASIDYSYPTRTIITRHPVSSDSLSRTPSNPNSGQSGASLTKRGYSGLFRQWEVASGKVGVQYSPLYSLIPILLRTPYGVQLYALSTPPA